MFVNPFLQSQVEAMMSLTTEKFDQILEKGMTTRTIEVNGITIITFYITSFGIAVGGGSMLGEPVGGGGGGGTIPCALVIIKPDGEVIVKDLFNEGTLEATDTHRELALDMVERIQGRRSGTRTVEKTVVVTKNSPLPTSPTGT